MLIEKNNVLSGNFRVDGDLVVEGSLQGDVVVTGTFCIGPGGKVEGTVRCTGATIRGGFDGTLWSAAAVRVHPAALLRGSVLAREVVFDEGDRAVTAAEVTPGEPDRPREEKEAVRPPSKIPLVTGTIGKLIVKPTSILKG